MELLVWLENSKQLINNDGESEFDRFFYSNAKAVHLSYTSMINILKADVALMLYSLVEFTVVNLINNIYDEIQTRKLSYDRASEEIRKLWRTSNCKYVKNNNVKLETIQKKTKDIIESVLNKKVIKLNYRDSLPTGNLNAKKIYQLFLGHGMDIYANGGCKDLTALDQIRETRNKLAHGEVSFEEAVRQLGISDLKQSINIIADFLDSLIELVNNYLDCRCYEAEGQMNTKSKRKTVKK